MNKQTKISMRTAFIDYDHEWPAAVCTAIPHLSVQCVQYMEPFFVPSVLPPRDRLDQLNPALF